MMKTRISFQESREIANDISSFLFRVGVVHEICGAIRRGSSPTVGNIPIIVDDFPLAWDVIHVANHCHGVPLPTNKLSIRRFGEIKKLYPIPIKIHHAYEEEWGAMRLHLTGNYLFIIQMRSEAKRQDMTLNQYGLWFRENIIAGRTEEQIFEALDIPFIPPFKRELKHKQKLAEVILSL